MALTATDRARTPDDTTELWYTRCPVPTASSIAIVRGALDDEFAGDGIAVSSLRASGDASVRESHFDHTKADSFRQGGNIPPIWSRSRGGDLRLVGLSWIETYQAVISLPGSGIETPADLKGKRLGVNKRVNDQIDFWRASAVRGFRTALGTAGLTLADAEIVELPVEETYLSSAGGSDATSGSLFGARSGRRIQAGELIALIRGEVDAIFTHGARGVDNVALLDAHVVLDITQLTERSLRIGNSQPNALTVSGELLERRPDLVARYLAATLRSARWAADHADETQRIIAREVGFAEEWVPTAYPGGIHATLTPSLDEDLVVAIESQKDFLLEQGFIPADFDVREWIAAGPLEEARRIVAEESQ
jgi:ABC-type nitrate/sulfonate/bicarbonate transport system substrate-binding protein